MKHPLRFPANIYVATAYQLFVSLFFLWITRFIFAAYNADAVSVDSTADLLLLSFYGLRFDLSAVAYFDALFILLRILPFGFTTRRGYVIATDIVWYITNFVMIAVSIADIPFFRFTGARMRMASIDTITTDPQIAGIVFSYAGQYWWAFLLAALFFAAMVWCYRRVTVAPKTFRAFRSKLRVTVRVILFLLLGGLTFLAMRGRAGAGKPLAIPDAMFYVKSTPQINVVLNTPYTILRSLDRIHSNSEPRYTFFTDEELSSLRTSVHRGDSTSRPLDKNVVIVLIESGGSNFIDSLNMVEGDSAMHLMPFLDSLVPQSLTVLHNISAGRTSCGGATAVLGGFPSFDPVYYMLSPNNTNTLDTPASLLGRYGWHSAFFYGCNHGSFNIDQMAAAAGFKDVYSREEYGYDKDFDGIWGIFDVPMAHYVVSRINDMPQPFIASWFTVSAHGPFTLPDDYDTSGFRHPEVSPERGLEYTDRALAAFFADASKQPWYDNTIFVITGDHGNRDFKGTIYDTPWIHHHIPLIIYTPDGSIAPGCVTDRVMSQFDIAPTLLSLMRYPDDYVAVGTDLFDDSRPHYGIDRFADRYYVYSTEYGAVISHDGERIEEFYNLAEDQEMKSPMSLPYPAQADSILTWTQAFLQDYTHRLLDNRLYLDPTSTNP